MKPFCGAVILIVAVLLTDGAATLAAPPAQNGTNAPVAPVARLKMFFPEFLRDLPTRLPTQKIPDGPLMGNGDMAVAMGLAPERLQFWLAKNDFWRLKTGKPGPRVFGWLDLEFPGLRDEDHKPKELLRAEQAVADGVVSTRIKSRSGETELTVRSWVSATENLLVVEMALLKGPPVEARAILNMAGSPPSKDTPFPKVSPASEAGVFWGARGFGPDQADIPVEAACAVRLLGTMATDVKLEPGMASFPSVAPTFACRFTPVGQSFELEPGRPVTLVAAVRSQRQSPDYLEAVRSRVADCTPTMLAEVKTAHAAWWLDYWSKSFISLNDPLLEWRYYASLYLLGAAIRDPEFPPGINGPWTTTDSPSYRGDYTLDYEAQAPFFGLCAANRIEQADANVGPALAFVEKGKEYARLLLDREGVLYPVGLGPLGIDTTRQPEDHRGERHSIQGVLWLGMKSHASYCTVILSERWFMTRDLAFARRVYPFLREVATFWEHDLTFENGTYNTLRDGGREGNLSSNAVTSLGLIRVVMRTAIDMAAALDVDAPRREKWRHILTHLAPFATQTWKETGKTVFIECEEQPMGPTHAIGLWHIFPFGALGLESDPREIQIAHNTIERLAAGNPAMPTYDRWYDINGQTSWYPAVVRVGYDPRTVLAALRGVRFQSNGVATTPFDSTLFLANCSLVPNTLDEMLLQSHQDVLRLFPCWPRDKDARFGTLRAYGAFLVSAALVGGEVRDVTILSEKGRDCTLVNPWPGRKVTLVRNGTTAETLSSDRFTFKTSASETIAFNPNGFDK